VTNSLRLLHMFKMCTQLPHKKNSSKYCSRKILGEGSHSEFNLELALASTDQMKQCSRKILVRVWKANHTNERAEQREDGTNEKN
jgi:hypothetical protein